MRKPYYIASVFLLIFAAAVLPADEEEAAQKYLDWALKAESEGRVQEAETALLRALDYKNVSSDISYTLARIENILRRDRYKILGDAELALVTNRWRRFDAEEARQLKAEVLLDLKEYDYALREIKKLPVRNKAKNALLLKCFMGLNDRINFRRTALAAITDEPFNTELARLVFRYAALVKNPAPEDEELVSVLLKRLYVLLEADKSLAYLAAPFIYDVESARILLSGVIAESAAVPRDALPVLLNLGVIDDFYAVNALFETPRDEILIIDKSVLTSVYKLLRGEEGRASFREKISFFTGTITRDENNDEIIDSQASYKDGILILYNNDRKQTRTPFLTANFKGSQIESIVVLDENYEIFDGTFSSDAFKVNYGTYPAVFSVDNSDVKYFFRAEDFYYAPVSFEEIAETILFPVLDYEESKLTEKVLLSFAYIFERPSREFIGALESVRLLNGRAFYSFETLNGRTVSQTYYDEGKPVMQIVDTDLDGTLETKRYFDGKTWFVK